MDLDSDSDGEDPWSSESTKNSNKISKDDSMRRKIKEKLKVKENGRESSHSPVPQSNQQDTKSNNAVSTATNSTTASNTTYYSPTKSASTDNTSNNNEKNNTEATTNSAENNPLSTQNHDYSTYDLDRVSGLPAPHSAAAMGDVERLKGFAVKQVNLLQSLDQAQRQPVRLILVLLCIQTCRCAGLFIFALLKMSFTVVCAAHFGQIISQILFYYFLIFHLLSVDLLCSSVRSC